MDWLKALNTFFKIKDVYDKGKEVKKLHDYGKKLDPKKVTWDDLKYFENKQMTEATKAGRKAEAAVDAALATKVEWPESGASSIFFAALKAADKYGADSRQAKAAVKSYYLALVSYENMLLTDIKALEAHQKALTEKIATAKALKEYGRVLHDAFMQCAKIPNPTGTAGNAAYFSLSQDAQQFAGIAGSLETKMTKLKTKNALAISEGKELVKTNKLWIKFASGSAANENGALKKNAKTARPK